MPSTKTTVLLAEDDSMLVDMYSMKFEGEGFEVWKAGNGVEALKLLEEKGVPDILLLDVMMPQMDGFTALQKMKANDAWKNIPVILLTNLGQESDVKRGKELGAIDYLIKANLTPAQVVEKVKEVLSNEYH